MHLEGFPEIPAEWRNDKLAAKWDKIRRVRRVVTGALEVERAAKRIGSSLEAAPDVYVADASLQEAFRGVDLAEVAITSAARLIGGRGARRRLHPAGGARRRRGGETRTGPKVRTLLAHPARRGHRPGVSGPVAARRRRSTRVRLTPALNRSKARRRNHASDCSLHSVL